MHKFNSHVKIHNLLESLFYVLIFCAVNTSGPLLTFPHTHRGLLLLTSLDVGNQCLIKRISGGKRNGEKLAAGSNSSEQGVLSILLVGCTDLWERISNGEDGFIIPKLDSLVGEISFFFLSKLHITS